jgi:hypothetical protein
LGLYRGVTALVTTISNPNPNQLQEPPLALDLNAPIVQSPSQEEESDPTQLTRDRAEQIVRTWLSRKALALGPQYQIDPLDQILTEPLLSLWLDRAQTFVNRKTYQQFRHSVAIEGVSSEEPNQGEILASVREVAKYYRNGREIPSRSYDSTLKVRYDVVREEETWKIREIEVIN